MPSMLDDAELDSRWRAGLEAAAEPGRWVEADARVARRLAARRHRRTTTLAAVAATVVVAAVVALALTTTGGADKKVRTADRAPVVELSGGLPLDSIAVFTPDGTVEQRAAGDRIGVQLDAWAADGAWILSFDENPSIRTDPARAGEVFVHADIGVHPVTLTPVEQPGVRPVHGSLTVVAAPPEPTGPVVATVQIRSTPVLSLVVTPDVVPAGVIQLDYATLGGTHSIVIDGVTGLVLSGPTGTASRKVELAPGTYRLHDTIPGHDQAGEHATLTVVAR